MIRLTVPSLDSDDLEAVRQVLISGQLVQGPRVAAFEEVVSKYVGTKYAVAVSSCTAALHLALLSLGIGANDLVIVTAFSYVATANVIELCGARPVFVDICPDTFNMDPDALESALGNLEKMGRSLSRLKAVIPVHTFGQLAHMPGIMEIAERYRLPVIEDAACALGATHQGRPAGTWGIMGCFSFHPRKAITTGEGGVITTNDLPLNHRLRVLRNHGQNPDSEAPDFVLPGFNYRMTDFQAALGTVQMAKLDRIIAARRRLAAVYDKLLRDSGAQIPVIPAQSHPVYQAYVVLLPENVAPCRNRIISILREKGIETTIGTYHIPLSTFYRIRYDYQAGDFPVTDQVFLRALSLPLHERLTEEEQRRVVLHLREAIAGVTNNG